MSCKICGRPIYESVYCRRHALAYMKLEEAYEKWRYALGVTWLKYLEKVIRVSGSGRWVRDFVEDIFGS